MATRDDSRVWAVSCVATAFLTLIVSPLEAQFNVTGPDVDRGALALEVTGALQLGYENGEGAERQGLEIGAEYGLTDAWAPAVVLKLEEARGASMEVTSLALENKVEIGTLDRFDLGLFAALEMPLEDDRAFTVEGGPIVRLTWGPVMTTINPFLEKEFGDERAEGTAFKYDWQGLWEVRDAIGIGFEAFGTVDDIGHSPPLGRQEHRIGPVLAIDADLNDWGLAGGLAADVGVLFGLTEATADYTVKWSVEYGLAF